MESQPRKKSIRLASYRHLAGGPDIVMIPREAWYTKIPVGTRVMPLANTGLLNSQSRQKPIDLSHGKIEICGRSLERPMIERR
jgi:hypothetical protein